LYDLAFHLGTPMHKLLDEMPQEELVMWGKYFEARPIGWREDSRAGLIMQSQGAKVKPNEVFPALAQLHKWEGEKSDAEASNQSLRRSPFGALLARTIGDKT
jgi:hypothetical protein